MTDTADENTILILDDELYNMIWMVDFLDHKGYSVMPATSANEAVSFFDKGIYRAAIVDLNVPILPPLDKQASELGSVYVKYPGLYVARMARNAGYRGRQVVIYSVHKDEEVNTEIEKLGCTYILKGRPKQIKEEIERILSYDPTA